MPAAADKPPVFEVATAEQIAAARSQLDAHTVETVAWHFHEATGCPFWLEYAKTLSFDPLKEVKCFDDLKKFPPFEDEWLRGGPVRRWVPKGLAGEPIYVFETGGTTGVPKSRVNSRDFRTDYEMFSETLPEESFPKGANWLMLGPSGPRRLRLSIEHLAQYRGGICFCIDLDPRWVIKLIQKGWMEHLEAYKQHCIDQAITILEAGHDIRCLFTTPKLLGAGPGARKEGHDDPPGGHHRNLFGWHRVHAAVDPVRRGRAPRRRVHDAHLRQHTDGPGRLPADGAGRRLHDRLLRPPASRCDRGGRF